MPRAAPDAQTQIAALNRARDLAAQAEQGTQRLVFSMDGNVYACMSGLADSLLDLEPPPRREHPNSNIGFGVTDAEAQRHAILRRVDLTESFNPPQLVFHQPEDGSPMKASRCPGVFVGLQEQHSFQVMYAGGSKWRVGAGKISVYGEVVLELPAETVEIPKGWICVKSKWTIVAINDYRFDSAKLVATTKLNDNQFPEWSLDDNDVLIVADGSILHPIAYVDSTRNGKRPLIQQTITRDLAFQPTSFTWGLTGPTTTFF
ncbi:MAG: hypothetical protein J0L73_28450 [Verrucomicrobia bacterium]|nr:hypothetical protein [Verrucomicrobiota bacterium]